MPAAKAAKRPVRKAVRKATPAAVVPPTVAPRRHLEKAPLTPTERTAEPLEKRPEEPVWLVRAVLVLFLVGFAAFLAREVYLFVHSL